MHKIRLFITGLFALAGIFQVQAQVRLVPVGQAWSANSINANILRHNSIVSHQDQQYIAYYDQEGFVVLGKRNLDAESWEIKRTPYRGNIRDAHNTINIMVDGDGYLHLSWDHHNDKLRYCRSKEPGSLELTEKIPMTSKKESRVTYPEFYRLPNGDLLFLYRDGASGQGDLMMNHYDLATRQWTQRQDAFLNGEGQRNAYWQMCTDQLGTIHISWVWRETGDVATNHDMGYAKSTDGGKSWLKANGEAYKLPITAANTEYAARIPQAHALINTTSMCADAAGNPYIATYFRPEGTKVPQYHLIYHDGNQWHTQQISDRKTPFSLSGGGTKRIPICRPRIVAQTNGSKTQAYMLFRDVERENRVSLAICKNLRRQKWQFQDLTNFSVGLWEPSYDTELWKNAKQLHVYVQKVGQGDGEKLEEMPAQKVYVLQWKP
jgi:hypothetical protein